MEFHEFLNLIARKRKKVYGIIALFLIIAAGVIAVQRFKYSSKSQLLVVQEYSSPVDVYTASKSSEHLSSVLASVVTSNSFFTKVLATGPTINAEYFGDNGKDQMKQWSRTVTAKSINDSGIIAITVYHPNRAEAEKIAGAINYVLMTQHGAYDGANDAVKVRLIDQPVTSSFPVKPNIPLIAGLAVALGLVFSLIYIYLLPDERGVSAQRLSFEDVMTANAALARQSVPYNAAPAYAQPAHPHANSRVRGQLPEEALANISGVAMASPHLTPYGHHSHLAVEEEAGYDPYAQQNDNSAHIEPEDIIRQGSMRNILQ